jgi:putative transposase
VTRDSQSVPTARQGGPARGYDGGKNVKGRKRHVVVDTMGLLLGVFVCEAGPHDSQKAPHVLQKLLGKVPRLKTIFADKGYEATPDGLIWRCFGWLLEVVRRDEDVSGFDPIPKRWVIERTFGWFASWRRLGRDYEYRPESSEAMIQIGMSRLMISRIR